MRILQITTILRYGSGKVVTDLATKLVDRGHNVQVASAAIPEIPSWESLTEKLDQAAIKRHTLNTFKRNPESLWTAARELNELLQDETIELIHAHSGTPCYLAWLAGTFAGHRRVPLIGTLHGFTNRQRPDWIDAMDRFSWNRCDNRIAVSKECATIANNRGIDCQSWIRPGLIGNFSSKQQPAADDSLPLTLVNIGEIEPRKGQLDLIFAAAVAANKLKRHLKCILVGAQSNDAYLQEIKNATIESPWLSLSIPGETNNPHRYLDQADFCFYPSYSEGLGLSVIESIASGKPTGFSYSSGCKDIADTIGMREMTFPPGDIKAIADLLVRTISDPQPEALHHERAKQAKALFSSKNFCNEYEGVYRAAIASR